jgi:DNA invertase Pin-like site-specific DNA recombinase
MSPVQPGDTIVVAFLDRFSRKFVPPVGAVAERAFSGDHEIS